MKTTKLNIIKYLGILMLLVQLQVGCISDEIFVENKPDRLFSPALFTPYINTNVVSLSWVPIANATYLLELSKDSLEFAKDLIAIPLDGVTMYTFSDLWSNARYSARIKALSKDATISDSKYQEITFKTKTENIFYNIAETDIFSNKVILNWVNVKQVSRIVVYIEGTENPDEKAIITLTEEDIASGTKTIDNLTSGTSYIFEIYLGDMLRGTTWALTLNE